MNQQGYTLKDAFGVVVLLIIFVLIPLGVYLTSRQTAFFSKADANIFPSQVKISNISEDSLTISWVTLGKAAIGFVSFGNTSNLGNSLFDDRDTDVRTARFTHYVTLKNLNPQTKYYFKIGSAGVLFDNNGMVYEAVTAPISETPLPLSKSIAGRVTKQDGSMPDEAIIYITTQDGYLLSGLSKSGNWSVPLHKARNADLSKYAEFTSDEQFDLMVQTGKSGSTNQTFNLDDELKELNITIN